MIGRTNAVGVNSGGSGGVTTVDLPTHPASIAYNAKNQNVDIILTYSSTDLVSGVRVAYKTGAYPENPDDGEYVEIEGTAENVNVPNLTNGTTYYFRVFLYREIASVKYFQTDITNARILCIPRAVEVTGITPMVQAADHLVFTESGTFTLTANTGTRIILGSGGGVQYANSNKALVGEKWAKGGYVKSITLTEDVFEAPCIMTIAGMFNQNTTTLKINSTSYTSGSTQTVIDTKWGPIGGNGGEKPTGAGGGRGGEDWAGTASDKTPGTGGNNGGYGNFGGNGSLYTGKAQDGASGKAGKSSNDTCGPGGGGGYAAGGGPGAYGTTSTGEKYYADNGEPGTGIVVIEWD